MFSERLKTLRKEKDLTQKKLAELLELAPSTIGMYEQGRRDPETEILKKLADLFDVSIDYLLGRTNDKKGYVKPEEDFEESNILFKNYNEIYEALRKRLIDEGLLEKNSPIPKDMMKLITEYGKEAGIQIFKSKKS